MEARLPSHAAASAPLSVTTLSLRSAIWMAIALSGFLTSCATLPARRASVSACIAYSAIAAPGTSSHVCALRSSPCSARRRRNSQAGTPSPPGIRTTSGPSPASSAARGGSPTARRLRASVASPPSEPMAARKPRSAATTRPELSRNAKPSVIIAVGLSFLPPLARWTGVEMAMRSILFKARHRATGIPGVAVLAALLVASLSWSACASSRSAPAEAPPAAASHPPEPPRPPNLSPVPAAAPAVEIVAKATIGAAGDVLMHDAVKQAAAQHRTPENDEGFGWLWAPVADLLSSADVTFANLESPIAPQSGRGSRSFVFNAPPQAAHALRRAGVRLVSVANNHAFDQGRAGFEETLRQLEAAGMPYVGAGEAGHESGPRVVEVNGLKLAFLASAHFFPPSGHDCPAPTEPRGKRCDRASLLDPERAAARG